MALANIEIPRSLADRAFDQELNFEQIVILARMVKEGKSIKLNFDDPTIDFKELAEFAIRERSFWMLERCRDNKMVCNLELLKTLVTLGDDSEFDRLLNLEVRLDDIEGELRSQAYMKFKVVMDNIDNKRYIFPENFEGNIYAGEQMTADESLSDLLDLN